MTTANSRESDASGLPEPAGWSDTLTGLEGPEFWRKVVVSEVARAARYKRPMTIVILDVDGMADMPEVWGPEVARHTLRDTAQHLRRMARTSDHVTRIGVVRFGILLTETDEIAAINFVERIRSSGATSVPPAAGRVRFVFGWASPKAGETPDDVVRRAEERMDADRPASAKRR